MTDFEEIIVQCVNDIYSHLNCKNSSSLDKYTVGKIVCAMDASNEYICDDFERAFADFGKDARSTMTKSELINFIKFMQGFPELNTMKRSCTEPNQSKT